MMLIGIIISGVVEEYTANLCKGIEQAASRDDVKCVVIPGKYVGMNYESDLKNKYGYCFNSLFSYGLLECFDGLIIEMSSVTMYTDEARKASFVEKFEHIPHVFVAYDKPGYSNVIVDNKAGLREALDYMFKNGARKFAMLGGPDNNLDAIERHQCFDNFLCENNLPNSPDNYVSASFFLDSKPEGEILFSNNKDADAFVCANDVIAKNFYEVLKKHNVVPGKDCSVVGFDDSDFCVTTYPTIASVRTDISEVGRQSFWVLMETINRMPVRRCEVPSQFVLRDSVAHKASSDIVVNNQDKFDSIIKSNVHMDDDKEALAAARKFYNTFHLLDDVKEDDILGAIDAINKAVDEVVYTRGLNYIDWELLINDVESKYTNLFYTRGTEGKGRAVTISYIDLLKKLLKYAQTVDDKRASTDMDTTYEMEAFYRDTMQFARNTEANYSRFLENLGFLGIHNAYLYLYDDPISYIQGEVFEIPELLNLRAVLENGTSFNVPVNSQKIKRNEVFTNEYVKWDSYKRLTLFPIYAENYLYGVVVCDMNRKGFKSAEMFTNQISSAVRMLQLRIENNKIMNEYEESVRKLKENNITLDTMTKTDPLTGLNNRRGFYVRFDKLMGVCPNERASVLVGYADMNDLKVINDRFGHDDGDYALRTIGSLLTDFVTMYNGFAARIGGDEFAFVIIVPAGSDIENYRRELNESFAEFISKCTKAYNICISTGFCLINDGDSISVDDALIKADERLYLDKYEKKNSVIK